MIRWHIPAALLAKVGIENAYQLHRRAGIGYPTAARLFQPGQRGMLKFDVGTIEAVAKVLGVEPLTLLEWTPE